MKIILLWLCIILLHCCLGPTTNQPIPKKQNYNSTVHNLNGFYNIETVYQKNVSSLNLSLAFKKKPHQLSGFSGCNRFFGSYMLKKNVLKFNVKGSTKMACSKHLNTLQNQLYNILNSSHHIRFSTKGFTLFKNKKPLLKAQKQIQTNQLSFEYSARSRTLFMRIKINKDSIEFTKERKTKPLKITCDTKYWQTLNRIYNTLNVNHLSLFKAPSKTFQFDGAPLAKLKIIKDGIIYESVAFDHNNPPKEIAALVKEILSSIKNIE